MRTNTRICLPDHSMMPLPFSRRTVPENNPAFEGLPAHMIVARRSDERLAVHVAGELDPDSVPIVCLAGYERNMADFADFARLYPAAPGHGRPIVLIDLLGRGRSDNRHRAGTYGSINDARDVASVMTAFGVRSAILLGQGYGGQVVMLLAAERPDLIAGAILVDSGPVTDIRGLVRLHHNLVSLAAARGETARRVMFRRILSATYPDISEARAVEIAARTHVMDRRGRQRPLFDKRLVKALRHLEPGDVLTTQWPYFEALNGIPLMMFRTQLSDQLRRETFEEMMRRRPDATALVINGQGAPALLDHPDEVRAIADFVEAVTARAGNEIIPATP